MRAARSGSMWRKASRRGIALNCLIGRPPSAELAFISRPSGAGCEPISLGRLLSQEIYLPRQPDGGIIAAAEPGPDLNGTKLTLTIEPEMVRVNNAATAWRAARGWPRLAS